MSFQNTYQLPTGGLMKARFIEFDMDPMTNRSIAMTFNHKAAIIRELALRYVNGGCDHATLRDAAEQAALDCKGIDRPSEIKRLFRNAVRTLQRRGISQCQ